MRARQTRRRRAGVGLVVAGLVSVSLASGVMAAGPHFLSKRSDRGTTLKGLVKGDRESRVVLTLERDNGAKTGRFTVTNFSLPCDDGSFPRLRLPPVKLTVLSSGRLEGTRYRVSADGTEEFVRVKGQLESTKGATGVIVYFRDVADPPTGPPPSQPDCATVGDEAEWRVGQRRGG